MNAPFHQSRQVAPLLDGAARAVPTSSERAPQTLADKLASGELYVMTREDAEDRAWGGVYVRTDYITGIDLASWRDSKMRWHCVAINVPLCGGCDAICLGGVCDDCAEPDSKALGAVHTLEGGL